MNIGVLTFQPLPKMFFNKKIKNFKISNFDQKIFLLKKLGVDFIINKHFNYKFSQIRSLNFIQNIIFKKLNSKFLFVSNNFRFGFKREGDVKQLISHEHNFGYKIVKSEPFKIGKKVVSSTLIRNLLEGGYLKKANKLLKRNWCIIGQVKKGR